MLQMAFCTDQELDFVDPFEDFYAATTIPFQPVDEEELLSCTRITKNQIRDKTPGFIPKYQKPMNNNHKSKMCDNREAKDLPTKCRNEQDKVAIGD